MLQSLERKYSEEEILQMIEEFFNKIYGRRGWTGEEIEYAIGLQEYYNHLIGIPYV